MTVIVFYSTEHGLLPCSLLSPPQSCVRPNIPVCCCVPQCKDICSIEATPHPYCRFSSDTKATTALWFSAVAIELLHWWFSPYFSLARIVEHHVLLSPICNCHVHLPCNVAIGTLHVLQHSPPTTVTAGQKKPRPPHCCLVVAVDASSWPHLFFCLTGHEICNGLIVLGRSFQCGKTQWSELVHLEGRPPTFLRSCLMDFDQLFLR